ncbi:hypothetical protein V1279_000280 [Bradyrhizobium sp. AZCC 1610]
MPWNARSAEREPLRLKAEPGAEVVLLSPRGFAFPILGAGSD